MDPRGATNPVTSNFMAGPAQNPAEFQDMEEAPATTHSRTEEAGTGAAEEDLMQQDATGEASRQQDGDKNWQIYHSRRQKKNLKRATESDVIFKTRGSQATENNNKMTPAATAGSGVTQDSVTGALQKQQQKVGAPRQPRQRLPPLPTDDAKIIIRPRGGLKIKDMKSYQATQAIIEACGMKFKEEDFLVRLRPGSNIVIASASKEEVADVIRKIKYLPYSGINYEVNAYVAMPGDVKRLVIHGLPIGLPSEILESKLRLRTQGVEILAARMLGKSETALITFDGPIIPKWVIFSAVEYKTYPYRPTRQFCYVCGTQGHRSDVCPTPGARTCRQCGANNSVEGHQCQPKCLVCGGEHAAGTLDCSMRLKNIDELRGRASQKSRGRSRSRRRRPRWLSSEGEQSRSRSRGRSQTRSRDRSHSRDSSFPPLGPPPAAKWQWEQQPKPQQQQKKGGVKVSSTRSS
ncbi:uncharacterized protein [Dermacentor andersoni]|uniref:uncharacterized protein n=1 Tax=Dermacentor andersoni TaxID=34620 RepID=UPI003B3AE034